MPFPSALAATVAPSSPYALAGICSAILPPAVCQAFDREEARHIGGPVLELVCGTARLTIGLAQVGSEATGLTSLPAMLAWAGRRAEEAWLTAAFVSGGMRTVPRGRRFEIVLLPCNSLGHATEPEALEACLVALQRHLVPEGGLAFDAVLRDPRHLVPPEEGSLDLGLKPISATGRAEAVDHDPVWQLRFVHRRIRPADSEEVARARRTHRRFLPQGLPLLLRAAGLAFVVRDGDFAQRSVSLKPESGVFGRKGRLKHGQPALDRRCVQR